MTFSRTFGALVPLCSFDPRLAISLSYHSNVITFLSIMTNAPEVETLPASAGPSTRPVKQPIVKPYPFLYDGPPQTALDSEAVTRGLREVLADTTAVVIGRQDRR